MIDKIIGWVKSFLPFYLFTFLLLSSCVDEEQYDDTPIGNFEALWKIMDEHYCFFEYKHEAYGLDWQQVYNKYNWGATGRGMRTIPPTSATPCCDAIWVPTTR